MSRNHAGEHHRPLGEQIGASKVAKAEKRVAVGIDLLTIFWLFVSWGSGLEKWVALCGIALKYAPLSKRFMRWIGDKDLPKLKK